ncbi:23S rRNA (uracil(1939)-C(5))-methyltransferase RlmD [Spirulina sp. CS-785/01]|uniref:23S rRNA (uracil(1939)-C(5))-methyltransferase RlmD n=1 Tax=Spirulina sp. CS-785/01 TaxID=3021716 RepID=UPI00232C1D30|nr:23S rRNA (uracil(1939)-C(5))-methyltransferase RlmD [Spirulina sp. CS-785/01]MDB9313521.1 23S rRNA (uracil(1939)-C(5))-methyltransferase RlmD [Spirulina sp. CS-785/01]
MIKENGPLLWQQGSLIELTIEDLSDRGDGVGRYQNRVVFVPDTVMGDRVLVRLLRVKRQYAQGKVQEVLDPSPHRIRPRCIVADKCGGCQWQHISDRTQQTAKENLLRQILQRIGGFTDPPLAPILTGESALSYRNKATYPLAYGQQGQVNAGYYRKGTHQLVNLNQCPVQDERLNPLLAEVKQDIQQQGWSIYQEKSQQGQLRHLSLRIGRRTGEILLTLVSVDPHLCNLQTQAEAWMQRYPHLVGVCLNINPRRGNVIFGEETHRIAGQPYLEEKFGGLTLQLRPETFFQVNTEGAEQLLGKIQESLNLQGTETLLDAYCGIGTFTLPLAQKVQKAIGIEVQPASIEQAKNNAQLNQIANVEFYAETVEQWLPRWQVIPDLVLLDPPRKGCDRSVLETLLNRRPPRLVYVSCKPATLARDLKILCDSGVYQLQALQPADFFPQTPHVECVAFLNLTHR